MTPENNNPLMHNQKVPETYFNNVKLMLYNIYICNISLQGTHESKSSN